MVDIYIEAEKHLAKLLDVYQQWEDENKKGSGKLQWARSDEALQLAVQYDLEYNYRREWSEAPERSIKYKPHKIIDVRKYIKMNEDYGKSPLIVSVDVGEHIDQLAAMRYAIVLAVIKIIEVKMFGMAHDATKIAENA